MALSSVACGEAPRFTSAWIRSTSDWASLILASAAMMSACSTVSSIWTSSWPLVTRWLGTKAIAFTTPGASTATSAPSPALAVPTASMPGVHAAEVAAMADTATGGRFWLAMIEAIMPCMKKCQKISSALTTPTMATSRPSPT